MDETSDLLSRWRQGDTDALNALLERDLEWIQGYVHQRLGNELRRVGDTTDFVQDAALLVLKNGPRFVLSSRAQFRALLAKIVLNVLRGKHRELHALKRDAGREKRSLTESVLDLDGRAGARRPDEAAAHEEEREWLRLAMLTLEPADQEVLDLHWQGHTDREIGERIGTSDNTARMRRSRAVARLTKVVLQLKRGEIGTVVES